MKRFLAIVAILSFFASPIVATPAFAKNDCTKGNTGQSVGAVVGGLMGGILGRKVDKRAGTLIGGLAGTIVGSEIGKALDKCEQQKVADTTISTLDGPEDEEFTQSWSSETREGVNGTITASPTQSLPDGRVCRMVTRVNYVDGEELHDTPMFCKKPPSTAWTPT